MCPSPAPRWRARLFCLCARLFCLCHVTWRLLNSNDAKLLRFASSTSPASHPLVQPGAALPSPGAATAAAAARSAAGRQAGWQQRQGQEEGQVGRQGRQGRQACARSEGTAEGRGRSSRLGVLRAAASLQRDGSMLGLCCLLQELHVPAPAPVLLKRLRQPCSRPPSPAHAPTSPC